jgi:predicted O-methyltransferase YrrM
VFLKSGDYTRPTALLRFPRRAKHRPLTAAIRAPIRRRCGILGNVSQELWSQVDAYISEKLIAPDPALEAALRANAAAGLPEIDVAPTMGKFLELVARLTGARRILEIGTLGGYSTIWLARALPRSGKLVTMEANLKHAEVAAGNIRQAGLDHLVELRVGPALQSLQTIQSEGAEPFDFFFIDADKPNNAAYLEWAIRLSRPGAVIVLDNTVRNGAVVQAGEPDQSVEGARAAFDMISREPRLDATGLQTVGVKGYDGFVIAVVRA